MVSSTPKALDNRCTRLKIYARKQLIKSNHRDTNEMIAITGTSNNEQASLMTVIILGYSNARESDACTLHWLYALCDGLGFRLSWTL